MSHQFKGRWISDKELSALSPRNVFHRQLDPVKLDCSQYRDRHVLFRKHFCVNKNFSSAVIYLTADDYYKLYVNGRFVAQGPAPSYHFQYNYNVVDIGQYLHDGENVIAVHTLYQGLINRVWQSGDNRHGLICDLEIDGEVVVCSDETFLVRNHSGYTETGICGYQTQFLERYDSRSAEVDFAAPDFDDRLWEKASVCRLDDHTLAEQKSHMLDFERIAPRSVSVKENRVLYDFGANYVGYLDVTALGACGDAVTVRCGQELNEDGSLRFVLRANCRYEEEWILSGGDDVLDWFDYKAFRYAELELPPSATVKDIALVARHYPFRLKRELKKEYQSDPDFRRIWDLCIHTQKYGVQEVIQDCMEREKGFYLGDGCYASFTNTVLTGDDSMTRKMIDDAFASSFITDTLVTCMNCSHMQEIAEYPLILICLALWHYRVTGDKAYLRQNYERSVSVLEGYRRGYEKNGVIRDLDKWCVVEWPKNFQHDYDADLTQGQICERPHVSINAYYIRAVQAVNEMAQILELAPYRDDKPLKDAFLRVFYDAESGLFRDSEGSEHFSMVGNCFVYGTGLYPDQRSRERILEVIDKNGVDSVSFFCTFMMLMGFARDGETERMKNTLLCEGAWLRMLREGATTTFEGWGKDTKWNTSLFHMAMSFAALFLSDIDAKTIFS